MKNILSPSILAADFGDLRSDVMEAERAGVDCFHFDVMDGMFVPNISFGSGIIKSLREKSQAFFDVHMMVENPERYVKDMKAAGADRITIHYEATKHLDRALNEIREMGIEVGLALNPATPVSFVAPLLPLLDMLLIMSVNPGFGGQKLIPYTLDKISELKNIRTERGLSYHIGIDGGVSLGNIDEIMESGANFIIAGSSVFRPKDKIRENAEALLMALEKNEK